MIINFVHIFKCSNINYYELKGSCHVASPDRIAKEIVGKRILSIKAAILKFGTSKMPKPGKADDNNVCQ